MNYYDRMTYRPMGMSGNIPVYRDMDWYPDQFQMNRREDEDAAYWLQLYPDKMKRLQEYIALASDAVDYDDSFIYDEYPDRLLVSNLIQSVYQRASRDPAFEDFFEVETDPGSDAAREQDMEARQPDYPAGGGRNWLQDIISTLLYQELYRRRCQKRRHRNNWSNPGWMRDLPNF